MRTLSKDIMVICKGWGVSQYNHSITAALRHYISCYTGIDGGYIDQSTLIHFLGDAVLKRSSMEKLVRYINGSTDNFLYRNQFLKEGLIQIYISLLGLEEMDFSELQSSYKDIFNYCLTEQENQQSWWEHFGVTDVENDRR